MIFQQFFDSESSTYTYLIASRVGGEALLIDPVQTQLAHYIECLQRLRLALVIALDTHIHADHVTGLSGLQTATGCAMVMGEHSKASCLTEKVTEGATLKIENIALKVIYTPGHTDDSYSFYMQDRVFTGDSLLIRGTGRTDFQNGNAYAAHDSLFNKLLKLPEDTLVYPAHDYNGRLVSTIGDEKKHNPRLQVTSANEYAAMMHALNLPKPKLIDIAVPANLRCGAVA